ncbi:hypothetical protein [Thermovibrio ammonificans]|uniref:Cytochrome c-552/4 domain-containing protein n=1 Tax=Thermovibrio ammonificans (strain DSM 15698 / JCM 12110 / HB-1) TaxID=648996 RepID=E8T6G2_THEA1|nr:hypothetical protein [Thermovibrio ammonificans]ADU96746.1 hypothetical protein Theam_0779 [Thermovibrio ammonificans HB-1]
MRKLLLAALLIPAAAVAAENPLLSAPATDVAKWKEKLKEFERPELPNLKEYPKPFHSPNSYKYPMNDVCSACHTYAAHKKDRKFSPFYNAHGTFMSCNVCHFVKPGVTYSWAEIKGGEVKLLKKGDFYGLRYIQVGNRVMLSGEESQAKIVPVYNGVPVELPLKGNEKLLKDPKAVAKMHNALTEKVLKCEDCHKPHGALDFRALGFSPERVKDLEHNEIVKGLKEYKTIHFPNFIW